MPSQRAPRGIINPITNTEVCHVREAQYFFQAAEVYYKAHKQSECTDAFYALERVRYDGPEVLKEMMAEWLEKLEGEREKAGELAVERKKAEEGTVDGEGENVEELEEEWEEV